MKGGCLRIAVLECAYSYVQIYDSRIDQARCCCRERVLALPFWLL